MIKQNNSVSFSEIFNFASERFGVGWNPANDLFFGSEVLRYKGYDEFNLNEIMEFTSFYNDGREVRDFTDDEIKEMGDTDKANFIIGRFMIENNIDKLLILND